MLVSASKIFDEYHFGETSVHAVSFLATKKSLSEIIKESSLQIFTALDVSAHTHHIQVETPDFHKNGNHIKSKKILSPGTDGMIWTDIKNIPHQLGLILKTADCAPLTFSSKDADTIGIIHVGWKGLSNGIIENFSQEIEKLHINKKDISIWIGPMVGSGFEFTKTHFDETLGKYLKTMGLETVFDEISNEKVMFDFRKIIIHVLQKKGFTNIKYSNIDTNSTDNEAPSYRLGDVERISTLIYR